MGKITIKYNSSQIVFLKRNVTECKQMDGRWRECRLENIFGMILKGSLLFFWYFYCTFEGPPVVTLFFEAEKEPFLLLGKI